MVETLLSTWQYPCQCNVILILGRFAVNISYSVGHGQSGLASRGRRVTTDNYATRTHQPTSSTLNLFFTSIDYECVMAITSNINFYHFRLWEKYWPWQGRAEQNISNNVIRGSFGRYWYTTHIQVRLWKISGRQQSSMFYSVVNHSSTSDTIL